MKPSNKDTVTKLTAGNEMSQFEVRFDVSSENEEQLRTHNKAHHSHLCHKGIN